MSTSGGYGSGASSGATPPAGGYGTGGYDPGAPGGIPPTAEGYAEPVGGYVEGTHRAGYTESTYQPGGATVGGATAGSVGGASYEAQGGATATGPGRPDVEDESVGSLVGKLTSDVSKLMRQELDLAKAEMREEAKKAGLALGMLAAAAVAGLLFLIFLSMTLMWLLDKAMDVWLAALIVTLLWAILGAVLALMGKKKLAEVNPKPEQTIETLKEDKEWVQAQKN